MKMNSTFNELEPPYMTAMSKKCELLSIFSGKLK